VVLRWWDRWLKGVENGIEHEPVLRVWMQDAIPPAPTQPVRPGRWLLEPAWPSPNVETVVYALNADGLADRAGPEVRLEQGGPLATALEAGIWCPHGGQTDFAGDQRAADGMSLAFTSGPLDDPLEILGYPEVRLAVESDHPEALVAVRLCDVAPDGASTLISVGLLNLTHRDGHERLERLEPGRRYDVTVRLNVIGYAVPAGHRLRVAVSPSYWPWAWPSPKPATLGVYAGASALHLPLRRVRPGEPEPEPFDEPESLEQPQPERIRTGSRHDTIQSDRETGRVELTWDRSMGVVQMRSRELDLEASDLDVFTITEGDPLTAQIRSERMMGLGRPGWRTRVETVSTLSADAEVFHLTNQVDAYEGTTRIFTKSWTRAIPRDGV